MNTYFIHIGNESVGPFRIDELKNKNITKSTPVWCQGMENWKHAEEVDELKSLVLVQPPPISPMESMVYNSAVEHVVHSKKILGLRQDLFILFTVILTIAVLIVGFNIFEDNRLRELELKNSATEKNNEQFQLQLKEIEEQKQRIAEQERLEAQRLIAEKKQQLNNRLMEVKGALANRMYNLQLAKDKLVEANNFEFLRSFDEKNDEVNLIQSQIDNLISEIDKLTEEKDQIFLELEKLQPKVNRVAE